MSNVIKLVDNRHTSKQLYMECPKCGDKLSEVLTTRPGYHTKSNLAGIGRERLCYGCKHKYRTLEVLLD